MRRHSILVLTAATFAAAACRTDLPSEPREPVRSLTPQEAQIAAASSAFGISLFAAVAAAESEPNVLVSPLSASYALGMTTNGAADATLDQLRSALGFAGLSQTEVNAAYRGLMRQLRARDAKVEFRLANAVFHDRGFTVQSGFRDSLRTHFDAAVEPLDFGSTSALDRINGWASDQTGGRVKKILEQIADNERMFLVNAVYFKAPWTTTFSEGGTTARPFRTLAGTTVQAQTMTRDAAAPHYTGDGVQMVELMYADTAYSMVLLSAADAATPLSAVAARLTAAQWNTWLARLETARIMLQLPKFRFDYGTELTPALQSLGVRDAFDPNRARFPHISTRSDLYITRVKQKAFIDVHERGTEAAAVTAVGVGVTSMPPSIHFDRPFIFAIRERSTGTILFMGRIGDPTR